MHQLRHRAVAVVSAAFLLVGSSMLAFPGTASAETKTVQCGTQVTANPGDEIVATLTKDVPLVGNKLLSFDLGAVKESTDVLTGTVHSLLKLPGWLLSQLSGVVCKVTVKVADTAADTVPGAGGPANTLKRGADGLNKTNQKLAGRLDEMVAPSQEDPPQKPDNDSSDESGASDGAEPDGDSGEAPPAIASPDSRATGGGMPLQPAFLPPSFSSGYAPMHDYSDVPFAQAGLFAPAPGVRYGSGVPGYQPRFDVLGGDGAKAPEAARTPQGQAQGQGQTQGQAQDTVAKAGNAEALPGVSSDGASPASVPVLLAVITLAASTAALVRTWVLRKA